jgi:hypothetical protein
VLSFSPPPSNVPADNDWHIIEKAFDAALRQGDSKDQSS